MAQTHHLKTLPVYFDAVERGDKPFEVRFNDRDYQAGDILVLQCTREDRLDEVDWDTAVLAETGQRRAKRELRMRVTWILTGGKFGIEPDHVVMAIEREVPARRRNLGKLSLLPELV